VAIAELSIFSTGESEQQHERYRKARRHNGVHDGLCMEIVLNESILFAFLLGESLKWSVLNFRGCFNVIRRMLLFKLVT
jgi:hypothetical protein